MREIIAIILIPLWIVLLVIWGILFIVAFMLYIVTPLILYNVRKGFDFIGDKIAKFDGKILNFVREYSTYNYHRSKYLRNKKEVE